MREFLEPTPVVDSDSAAIVAAAAAIAGDASDEEEVSRRLFLWVRDEVRHSSDHQLPVVTCVASDVLRERAGFCYAKSHLLAALLRARGIPAALCYQRLALDGQPGAFCLHGLVSVYLRRHGWYRVDPRGERPGIATSFSPPIERLAFTPALPGERDVDGRFADALPSVTAVLRKWPTAAQVAANLPDLDATHMPENENPWVEAWSCTWPHEAQFVRSLLEAADIEVMLPDEHTLSIDPGLIPAFRGVRVLVPSADLERAREVIGTTLARDTAPADEDDRGGA
jgi:transglutaminase-like putative cysteine protease